MIMKTELMQFAQTFEQEVFAYRRRGQHEFIKLLIDDSFC